MTTGGTDKKFREALRMFGDTRPPGLPSDSQGGHERSGPVYDVLTADPLFALSPSSEADVFVLFGDGVVSFLKRRGVTIDEIERARADSERRASDEAERLRKHRARQKQVPLRLDLVR